MYNSTAFSYFSVLAPKKEKPPPAEDAALSAYISCQMSLYDISMRAVEPFEAALVDLVPCFASCLECACGQCISRTIIHPALEDDISGLYCHLDAFTYFDGFTCPPSLAATYDRESGSTPPPRSGRCVNQRTRATRRPKRVTRNFSWMLKLYSQVRAVITRRRYTRSSMTCRINEAVARSRRGAGLG